MNCSFCHVTIHGLADENLKYKQHLRFFHKILFQLDIVCELAFPSLASAQEGEENSRDLEDKIQRDTSLASNLIEGPVDLGTTSDTVYEETSDKMKNSKITQVNKLKAEVQSSVDNKTSKRNLAKQKVHSRLTKRKCSVKEKLTNSVLHESTNEAISDHETRLNSSTLNEEEPESAKASHPWYYGCVYKCKVCQLTFRTKSTLGNHLRDKHNVSTMRSELEKCCTKVAYHHCKVCGLKVRQERIFLKQHLDTHVLTLEKYAARYGLRAKPWYDGCEYQCTVCHGKLSNRRNFRIHLARQHKFSGKRLASMLKSGTKMENFHQCKICGNSIRLCHLNLQKHMFSCHKISLDSYAKMHINFHQKAAANLSTLSETDSNPKSWSSGCTYRCQQCKKGYICKESIRSHLGQDHEFTESQLEQAVASSLHKKGLYECQLCNTPLLRRDSILRSHMSKVHKVTIKTYESRFHSEASKQPGSNPRQSKDLDTLSLSSDCSQIGTETSKLAGKEVVTEPNSSQTEPYFAASSIAQTCLKDTDQRGATMKLRSYSFQREVTDTKWYNGCTYQCQCCKSNYFSQQNLKRHLIEKHEMSSQEAQDNVAKGFAKKAYHRCRLCNIPVLQEYYRLRSHMDGVHHMSIKDYELQFHLGSSQHLGEELPNLESSGDPVNKDGRAANPDEPTAIMVSSQVSQFDCNKEQINFQTRLPLEASKKWRSLVSRRKKSAMSKWHTGCTFVCRNCKRHYTAVKNLRRHLRENHKLSENQMLHILDQSLCKKDYYTCRLCDKPFLCEYDTLRHHLKRAHGMDMKTYELTFHSNSSDLLGESDQNTEPSSDPFDFVHVSEIVDESSVTNQCKESSRLQECQGTNTGVEEEATAFAVEVTQRIGEEQQDVESESSHLANVKIEIDDINWLSPSVHMGSGELNDADAELPINMENMQPEHEILYLDVYGESGQTKSDYDLQPDTKLSQDPIKQESLE